MSKSQITKASRLESALAAKLENTQETLIQLKKQKKGSANSPKTLIDTNQNFRAFVCKSIPRIKFSSFLGRFTGLGKIPENVLIHAYIMFMRALTRNNELKSPHCTHKLFTGCVFLSYKYLVEHDFWAVKDFCKLGGITGDQLGDVESILLKSVLRYELYVSVEEFARTKYMLERLYLLDKGRDSGMYSDRSV